jgi:hypothetical protein
MQCFLNHGDMRRGLDGTASRHCRIGDAIGPDLGEIHVPEYLFLLNAKRAIEISRGTKSWFAAKSESVYTPGSQ